MSFENENTWNQVVERRGEEAFHEKFEKAIYDLMARLEEERTHFIYIGGRERQTESHFALSSPIDGTITLGLYPKGTPKDVSDAIMAAEDAFRVWRKTDLPERLRRSSTWRPCSQSAMARAEGRRWARSIWASTIWNITPARWN